MPATSSIPSIVSTGWLAERIDLGDIKVLDASWYLPQAGRDARAEFLAGHIPGAAFFDLDAASDPENPLPHMLPSASFFSAEMRRLGLNDGDTIIVYDGSGTNSSAARAWWMFRVFGHDQVAVLDGGLGLWRQEGRPLSTGSPRHPAGRFTAQLHSRLVRTCAAVEVAASGRTVQLLDARSRGRFEGTEPEPRPGLRAGHIPGSRNLPYAELVDSMGRLLPAERLRARFTEAGIDWNRPVIATCGSGVTACALVLGLEAIGVRDASVYDGSWTEWGAPGGPPVAVGPQPEES